MAVFDLDGVVRALEGIRAEWRTSQQRTREPGEREFPSREALADIFDKFKRALFPMRLGPVDMRHESENFYVGYTLDAALRSLLEQARLELRRYAPDDASVDERAALVVRSFAAALPDVRRLLDSDVLAAYQGDPAARSVDEVLLCYPGIHALIHHRLAHQLYLLELPLLARIAAEIAHGETGIDIHPGAQIGPGCFIDHGTGVVIGETARIGRRVRIYQAVTLGAKRFVTDADGNLEKGVARHPIVEDDVVIYAGATILGRVTLGRGAVIGGNVWITEDVAAGAAVTQAGPRSTQRQREQPVAEQEPAG
ncbi:serine O-acetyltransferase EpsC [Achromobacter seleniivolatilans]|uniref:serine O-acetyltransferase n=1 Tax=Achromobacter seleniivolatilans TaxID=3047478 RepID=A0ABY9M6C8_9BURK|nr:serine O-acetyltransferase EpsC [Achromobacter sp. R39]WMD22173.1 serine O-acetyltransferase EpsC [Achromobacter sp. R39]